VLYEILFSHCFEALAQFCQGLCKYVKLFAYYGSAIVLPGRKILFNYFWLSKIDRARRYRQQINLRPMKYAARIALRHFRCVSSYLTPGGFVNRRYQPSFLANMV